MLVISRRIGESLIIANEIKIKVLSLQGKQISLGIEAPSTIVVDREEIHKRKQAEKLQKLSQQHIA